MELDKHKKQFGSIAEEYTKFRKLYPEALYQLLFSLCSKKDLRILDIACGNGRSTERLLSEGNEVFGCDHDPLMIEEAKKQAKIKDLDISYVVADVEHLPFENNYFDIVTVGTAFHWFVNKKSITEIGRVLKNKGLLFIFWTLVSQYVKEKDQIPASFYQSYGWERVPSELRNLEYISEFLSVNNFLNVGTTKVLFVHTDTVEERVGLESTASSYGVLTENKKEEFLKELHTILKDKLGDRDNFLIEEEIQICYGFKG